jgi:hypothetical protein
VTFQLRNVINNSMTIVKNCHKLSTQDDHMAADVAVTWLVMCQLTWYDDVATC